MTARDPGLRRVIDEMAVPGILVDHRVIASGDELALMPEERSAFARSVLKVQRASGAARLVARELLQRFDQPERALVKSASGAPVWPIGFVGSIAHDAAIAIAAVARKCDFLGVGVDVEPAEPLDPDLLPIVATPNERERIQDNLNRGRVLFAVKEAIYKAVHPLDGVFLDHHDVEVSLEEGIAVVRKERLVRFRYCFGPHTVVLAFIPALSAAT